MRFLLCLVHQFLSFSTVSSVVPAQLLEAPFTVILAYDFPLDALEALSTQAKFSHMQELTAVSNFPQHFSG